MATVESCSHVNAIAKKCRLFVLNKLTIQRYLVDSGASISIISKSQKSRKPNKYQFFAADDSKIKTYDPLTKLSSKGEHFTCSEPYIKILASSLDSEYAAVLRDFPDLASPPPLMKTFGPPVHVRARKLNPQQSEAERQEFKYMLSIRALLSFLKQTGLLHCTWFPKSRGRYEHVASLR
ncbi:hypothetical protein TNIN_116511 [Trichonephila inaurata madagascariensis]|uniref:Peptidase A2 domain-containing protein n=1 Tax=Trichonephila inaurata madagascariensis TaxID=2747483 RepID=A0A8X6MLI2_9ARAC|nr:hypothetical protein TNIN_116511 [Trichonephila inaurata madagascariensis]